MRTGGTLFDLTHVSQMTTAGKATFSPPATIQRSPWHSPVPYLFGGLAAMLGLIAFALLILACSYWKLSGHQVDEDGGDQGGSNGKGDGSSDAKAPPVFEEKFLVIMAGDVNPTFLATPVSSRVSSLNGHEKGDGNQTGKEEKLKQNDQTIQENGEGESHVSHEQSQ